MKTPVIPIVEENTTPETWQGNPILFARQVLTGFLQGVFSAMTGVYRWDPDPAATRIFIAASSPIDATVFGVYPAIVVSRSGMQFANTGIGGLDDSNWRDGSVVRTDLVNGMFVVQHISRKEAEAENLAFLTAEMAWSHQALLARYGFILSGGPTVEQPGSAGMIVEGESKGLIAVPVILPYRCLRRVKTTPLGDPILQAVRFRITDNLQQFAGPRHPTSAAPESGDPADIGKRYHRWERSSQDPPVVSSSTRTAEPKKE